MTTTDYVASLRRIRPIGDGAFGEVHLFHDPVHGEVAGKCFFKGDKTEDAWENACASALTEAKNLKALEHSHVVKIHQVVRTQSDDEFLIVMEYCAGGSVRQITETNRVFLPDAKRIIRDAAMGLSYIHGAKYLHRDIKPDNMAAGAVAIFDDVSDWSSLDSIANDNMRLVGRGRMAAAHPSDHAQFSEIGLPAPANDNGEL